MATFNELRISDTFIAGLKQDNITNPTDIQSKTIEHILDNKDLIAEAITGSGKTLAYLLPSFQRIDTDTKDLHTLILAPTHELVIQIHNVIKTLAQNSNHPLRSTPIIGDVNIKRQIDYLKEKPHIIVGTPGRVLELIQLKKIKAHQIKTLVIDEADKLLSDSNVQTVKSIIKTTLRDRQLLAFSASISEKALASAVSLMKSPTIVNIAPDKVNPAIEHCFVIAPQRDKIDMLRKLIHAVNPSKAIVFINKNEAVIDVMERLNYHKIDAVAIFGNATKQDRKRAIDQFKGGQAKVLVASDLVARGLDLQNLSHIINMDIPVDLNEYIHRVGRTGRAGEKGMAISIITLSQLQDIKKIEKINNICIQSKAIKNGQLTDYK
ncbi:DEAD/DEAH box helicase [Petrocella sp. FN5]|uniref:DEAD/DEAH box helicase n=1 Tax=Petrocella sp. FN5 TaxID=3032002 RepID=UPI002ED131E9